MRQMGPMPDFNVIGSGFSRAEPPIHICDLTNSDELYAMLEMFKPDVVVHCAAERDPDRADQDLSRLTSINVDSSANLAKYCGQLGSRLVYISTDYVFDGGVNTGIPPPYAPDAPTCPVNNYGSSKLDGEIAVLAVPEARPLVLRVPVLYGIDCSTLSESASLKVAHALLPNRPPQTVCNWALRFPTCCEDVAVVLCKLLLSDARGLLHFSSPESVTKYELSHIMAAALNLPTDHLSGQSEAPAGAPRPQNTQLDCADTWKVIGGPYQFVALRDRITQALAPFRDQFVDRSE